MRIISALRAPGVLDEPERAPKFFEARSRPHLPKLAHFGRARSSPLPLPLHRDATSQIAMSSAQNRLAAVSGQLSASQPKGLLGGQVAIVTGVSA